MTHAQNDLIWGNQNSSRMRSRSPSICSNMISILSVIWHWRGIPLLYHRVKFGWFWVRFGPVMEWNILLHHFWTISPHFTVLWRDVHIFIYFFFNYNIISRLNNIISRLSNFISRLKKIWQIKYLELILVKKGCTLLLVNK